MFSDIGADGHVFRGSLEHLPALPVIDEQTHALVGIGSRGDVRRCVVTDPPLALSA